ncbi:hypothetical protein F511_05189 [Dorcoceras hygrometricum]|uniref:Uncharacterized protein n=1 Tax=Dorcoceras hygrometricum TaxID=472368 RepID=A0A2Z7C215_9LAMI|nr:hypothetical protein F511_05189 [Dorcoceras hygrometricum]
MEKESNRPVEVATDMNCTAENPSSCSLRVAKIYKKNQPSINMETVVTLQVDATEEEEETPQSTPPSPERKPGLQHPVVKIIMEQNLGKSVLNIGVPTAIAVLVYSVSIDPKTLMVFTYIMVSGLCIGCVAIWNGILLRETFPREANVMELSGIVLVLICLSGVVGSFLLREFVWLPILCGSSCLFPFIIMILPCRGNLKT